MCGLLGIVRSDGLTLDEARADAGRDRLAHRGPDSAGRYVDSHVYLGFRRLSILDLSPQGNQPMQDERGEVWIVFNGEIYNFVELRQELQARGQMFRTGTDTEVLLHLYRWLHTDMFQRLNGMFALAIYDRPQRRILLARDRLGKKPLFYRVSPEGLEFASELKALQSLPGFPGGELRSDAVNLYFRLGWVPNSLCIYPGVQKLPPSSWACYDLASRGLQGPFAYWALPPVGYVSGRSETEWLDQIEALLEDATRIRLRSDVPLGAFLSGGIDSGLVAAMAARHVGSDLKALTISFPGVAFDERPLAEKVGRHLRIHSVIREVDAHNTGITEEVLGHFDEPFADASAHPTSAVCALARDAVTVALSGDGGDELFAGYSHHPRAWRWRGLEQLPLGLRSWLSGHLVRVFSDKTRLGRACRRLGSPVGIWGMGATHYPFSSWIHRFLQEDFRSLEPLDQLVQEVVDLPRGSLAPIDLAQRFDLRLYLLDDILVKVDRMSMAHSLEVRCPLLDYRIVEMALGIPPHLRTKGGTNKYLLRRLAQRLLPTEVATAPKRGFGIPMRSWLFGGPQKNRFHEILLDEDKGLPDPLLPGRAEELWGLAEANDQFLLPLYQVLTFKAWCASNLRGRGPARRSAASAAPGPNVGWMAADGRGASP